MSEQSEKAIKRNEIEKWPADNGVVAKRVRHSSGGEHRDMLEIYGTRKDRYKGLDGEVRTEPRQVKVAELPAGNAYDVLVGLAEAHGYKLEGK